jgi:hypothetical protein
VEYARVAIELVADWRFEQPLWGGSRHPPAMLNLIRFR